MMIGACCLPQREFRLAIYLDAFAGFRYVSEEQVVRGIFFVDENDVFDLCARLAGLSGYRVLVTLVVLILVGFLASSDVDEAVVQKNPLRVHSQLGLIRYRQNIHRTQIAELRRTHVVGREVIIWTRAPSACVGYIQNLAIVANAHRAWGCAYGNVA